MTTAGAFPSLRFEFKRQVAEGDLVVLHSHLVRRPGDRGMAVVDIFRLENSWVVSSRQKQVRTVVALLSISDLRPYWAMGWPKDMIRGTVRPVIPLPAVILFGKDD